MTTLQLSYKCNRDLWLNRCGHCIIATASVFRCVPIGSCPIFSVVCPMRTSVLDFLALLTPRCEHNVALRYSTTLWKRRCRVHNAETCTRKCITWKWIARKCITWKCITRRWIVCCRWWIARCVGDSYRSLLFSRCVYSAVVSVRTKAQRKGTCRGLSAVHLTVI